MKYIGIVLVLLVVVGVLYWLNSGKYYTDEPKPKKEVQIAKVQNI